MLEHVYFFDSYAIIEIILGNKNYRDYADRIALTTKLNLFEVYYGLLRDVGEQPANDFLDTYRGFVVDFDNDLIKTAAALRLNMKKKDVSMTDCIGYCLAKKWCVKFLTGDKEFENMEHVEFVK